MSGKRVSARAVIPNVGPPYSIIESTTAPEDADQVNVWAVYAGVETRMTPFTDPDCISPPCGDEPTNARLSPNSAWIAYHDFDPGPGGSGATSIYVVRSDGTDTWPLPSGQIVWTDPSGFWTLHPSWHPDGNQIIFTNAASGDTFGGRIIVADFPAGSSTVLWTPDAQSPQREEAFRPHFSPDGTKIAFFVNIQAGGGGTLTRQGLWTMDADGSGAAVIDNWSSAAANHGYLYSGTQLAWSHDSQWIAYIAEGTAGGGSNSLYKIHPDGTGKTLLKVGNVGGSYWRVGHGAWKADDSAVIVAGDTGAAGIGIHSIPASGSGTVTTLISSPNGPAGGANFECCYRDPRTNRIWWANSKNPGVIRSCAIDGTDMQTEHAMSPAQMGTGTGFEWI